MTAKLSEESVSLLHRMFDEGHATKDISAAVGCATSTVVRYLNEAGIVIGRKGKPKQLTPEYLAMAIEMRNRGRNWMYIESKIGFHRKTFQRELKAQRNSV